MVSFMLFRTQVFKFFIPLVDWRLISMLANPVVRFLERKLCLVRKHSSMVIVAGALALVIGLIYLAVSNGARLLWSFMKDLPDLYAGSKAEVQESLTHLGKICLPMHLQASGQAGKNWEIIWGNW